MMLAAIIFACYCFELRCHDGAMLPLFAAMLRFFADATPDDGAATPPRLFTMLFV